MSALGQKRTSLRRPGFNLLMKITNRFGLFGFAADFPVASRSWHQPLDLGHTKNRGLFAWLSFRDANAKTK
jgi:hypothetical protein